MHTPTTPLFRGTLLRGLHLTLALPWMVAAAGVSLVAEVSGTNQKVPSLAAQLAELGMKGKFNEAGELTAVSNFRPAGRLPAALWQRLQATPALVNIIGSHFDAADVVQLSLMTQLEDVTIGGGGTATDEDLALLSRLPHLHSLNIHHRQAFEGIKTFTAFEGHPVLQVLKLHNCRPFAATPALAYIARLPKLRELEFTALPIKITDLQPLAAHPTLATVIFPVDGKKLTAFLTWAATLPKLEDLFLLCPTPELSPLTPAQIQVLAAMASLKKLRAINLGVTEAQAKSLSTARPGLQIELRRKHDTHIRSTPMEFVP